MTLMIVQELVCFAGGSFARSSTAAISSTSPKLRMDHCVSVRPPHQRSWDKSLWMYQSCIIDFSPLSERHIMYNFPIERGIEQNGLHPVWTVLLGA
jgi:hypothetical protein